MTKRQSTRRQQRALVVEAALKSLNAYGEAVKGTVEPPRQVRVHALSAVHTLEMVLWGRKMPLDRVVATLNTPKADDETA